MTNRLSKVDRYAGLAIGQRLFAAGLLEAFQRARTSRDRFTMVEILMTVAVVDPAVIAEKFLTEGTEAFALLG